MRRSFRSRGLRVALAALMATAAAARADEEPARRGAEQLAAEFNDPLTTVPQIFLKDVYSPANYGTKAQANRLIARLLIPRVPRLAFMPDQLIRPTFQLVTVPTGRGTATRTEFGDMQLFDLFLLPWSSRASGLFMGVGPTFVFPTATDRAAGQGAWQVGPALAAVYMGIPGVLVGTLVQNPISFAYTSSDRPTVNTLLVQPIAMAYVGRGFYVKSADATWAMGWREGSPTTIPLSLGIGYVLLHPDWPVLNVSVGGEWMAHRRDAPIAPQTSVNFGLSVAFPHLRPWK
jgi:hypothetical protein